MFELHFQPGKLAATVPGRRRCSSPLREMRRARTRCLLLIAAIGLLVFLILTQQAIQNGLITGRWS